MPTAYNRLALAIGATLGLATAAAHADTANSLSEAFTKGHANVGFRLRQESVDNGASDPDWVSLKTRLSFSSASYQGFGLTLEMDDVSYPTDDEIQASDPQGTEINQALVSYGFGKTAVKYGRQRILLDNQRFVGGVGFRQNEQTYDGLSVSSTALADTRIFAAYISKVDRIFGNDSPAGDHNQDGTYLLNVNYSGLKAGKLTGYHYLIDNSDQPLFSTATTGLRFEGKVNPQFAYNLEYASQGDSGDNPADYSASYLALEAVANFAPVTLTLGHEVLGADGENGVFITPLATLHKFQGWTDVFLNNGAGNVAGGIADTYANAVATVAGFKLGVFYHSFAADDSDAASAYASAQAGQAVSVDSYGSELALMVARKVGPVGLSVQYADYSADDFGGDVSKLWLTAEANF